MERAVKERFVELWNRNLFRDYDVSDTAEHAFKELLTRYGEPHRAYHTLDHVERALAEFDGCVEYIFEPDEVEMAVWFHDVVYDPKASDNEEQSARLFEQFAGGKGEPFVTHVGELIRATTHKEEVDDHDGQYLCDIDIAAIGHSYRGFKHDSENIRFEYKHVPARLFDAGRAAFLSSLLARPRIYYTDFFRNKYESRARANLEAEIARLNSRHN